MPPQDTTRDWTVLLIGGGAAVGKTTAATAVAVRYGASIVPVDAIWVALKAGTTPASHPELHYFDPSDEEMFELTAECLCQRHVKSAQTISQAIDPVIDNYLWERRPVVVEGAWITPAVAGRWTRQSEAVRAVFIHEPGIDKIAAAMVARSGGQDPSPRTIVASEVFWLFGNWVREQALAEGLPVVDAPPGATLAERVLAAIHRGSDEAGSYDTATEPRR